MNIVHIGLASYYTEGMTYQDNVLSEINLQDGHSVTYISNSQCWSNGNIIDVEPCTRTLNNGLVLVRMRYDSLGLGIATDKFRFVRGLYELLEELSPEIILSHDLSYGAVLQVIKYKRTHPKVKLYADTHTDAKNSGTNWLSLHILHRVFYRYMVQKSIPYLEKYFYTTKERKTFSLQNYGVPESLMEFYPLGGIIMSETERAARATKVREELCLTNDNILFVHSGKLDKLKRTTELIKAFSAVADSRFCLTIIGSMGDDVCEELEQLIAADERIKYLGWRSGDELQSYLCACSMYLQPGSQSATLENALCCGAPIMTYPHESYDECYLCSNGFYVETQNDMVNSFRAISDGKVDLAAMRSKSMALAEEYFDYRKLAARLYK